MWPGLLSLLLLLSCSTPSWALSILSERDQQMLKTIARNGGGVLSGSVFPSSPVLHQLFVITGADVCVEGSGSDVTLCRWDGADWVEAVPSSAAVTGWPTVNVADGVTWANSFATAFKVGKDTSNYWALYHDPTDGLQLIGVCAGVANGCNYIRELAAGKTFEVRDSFGAGIFTLDEATGAMTNAQIDTEASGNTLIIKDHMWRPFAACQNGTAFSIWDYGTSNTPTPACKGTTTTKGVLQFPNGATDLSTTLVEFLDHDWTGEIEAYVLWESASTSTNNVLWGIAIACAGPGENSDPAFTDDDFTADANNGTANTYNKTSANTVTTTGTCLAGKLMHIRVKRRLSQAGDTLAATAEGVGLYLVLRQAQ